MNRFVENTNGYIENFSHIYPEYADFKIFSEKMAYLRCARNCWFEEDGEIIKCATIQNGKIQIIK